MAGMAAGPGSDLGGPGGFAATWALMLAAMMLPAVAPMVAAYRGRTAGLGATPAFAAGSLITWLVTGLRRLLSHWRTGLGHRLRGRRGARLHGPRLAPGRGDHGFDAD